MRNGRKFVSVVPSTQRIPGVWDPFAYRGEHGDTLARYVRMDRPRIRARSIQAQPFAPIEYKHLSRSPSLTFALETEGKSEERRLPSVSEQVLLFGTLRAYLGNALVTPKGEWLGVTGRVEFGLRSEFLELTPADGLSYFWLAFLRSPDFLGKLPVGGGGTRPRASRERILETPVLVPDEGKRHEINTRLEALAEKEWRIRTAVQEALKELEIDESR